MLFSYRSENFFAGYHKGVVEDKSTGTRLEGVYVSVPNGNHKDITNAKGEFIIQTVITKGEFVIKKDGYGHLSISLSHDVFYIIHLDKNNSFESTLKP